MNEGTRRGRGKKGRAALLFLLCYLAALALLTLSERHAEGASIRSLGDALWYSLVTMTTVGYGDLAPVTLPGRIIGLLFLGMSVSLFGLLLHGIYALMTGRLVPWLRLSLGKSRTWYLFDRAEEETCLLAENLLAGDGDALAVFCGTGALPRREPRFCATEKPVRAMAEYAERKGIRCILFAEGGGADAGEGLPAGLRVIRRKDPEMPGGAGEIFDPIASAARQYWKDHPVRPREREILLVGDGIWARELLNRAILNNGRVPFQTTVYRVFGDWADYQRNHSRLGTALALNRLEEGRDSLFFEKGPWNEEERIRAADRIILCGEDREANRRKAGTLLTWFPAKAEIHLLGDAAAEGVICFGSMRPVLTPENVLRDEMNRLARAMNEHYRRRYGGPAWEELDEFTKELNRAAADHLFVKARLLAGDGPMEEDERFRIALERFRTADQALREKCRRNEHDRWMRFYCLYNWRQGEKKDPVLRTHPCIAPFEALSAEDQEKDEGAWELMEIVLRREGGTDGEDGTK